MYESSLVGAFLGLLGLSHIPVISEYGLGGSSKQVAVGEGAWQTFNATLDGRLQHSTSTSGPCATGAFMLRNVTSSSSSGGKKLTQWEECQARAANGGNNGFFVDARSAQDVVDTMHFVKETGAPLVTENLQSEFCAAPTSNAVALWFRRMNKVEFIPKFTPEKCSIPSSPAMSFQPGAGLGHIYTIADKNEVTVVGSNVPPLFGGEGRALADATSVLAPTFGSMVDNIIEMEVVTPDGELRTVNPCLEPDLWFALRGGGSAFGIITRVTVKAHPKVTLQTFAVKFQPSPALSKEIVTIAAHYALQWAKEGWGGSFGPDRILLTTPSLSKGEAWHSMAPLMTLVSKMGDDVVKEKSMTTHHSFLDFVKFYASQDIPSLSSEYAVSSRLVNEPVFLSKYGKDDLVKAIATAATYVESWTVSLSLPYGFQPTEETSFNPAFYESPWMVYFSESITPTMARKQQLLKYSTVGKAANYLRFITPGSGTYYAQADRSDPGYTASFWGKNYNRLVEIKKTRDPKDILRSWQSVGWKGPSSDTRFTCHTRASFQTVRCDRECR
ncbi:hypothetical protein FRB95_002156 [Tulasnella sp. JGI-2019a]|nr:hypothetical protein FRB95_002156 [Tulasnella sp. JGI-2019a]